ncbi:MAG: helix-hairpin-helix domain-containing protein, partial [Planctomycetia bacterium]|nr:helix-hairpin-helix domain-containing protein [Planctomycetia bacterium]
WLILLGNLMWDTCCSIKTEPLVPNIDQIARAKKDSSHNTTSEQDDPLAAYRIPGSEVLMPFRIEINTAPAIELQLLPGIGPALSKTIVAWREVHGPFKQIEDIKLVPGIGPKKYDAIKKFIYIQTQKPKKPKKSRWGFRSR